VQRAQALTALNASRSGNDATLVWHALHGPIYALQASTTLTSDPADWTPLSTQQRNPMPGATLAAMSFTHSDALNDARRFYRLVIEGPP